MRNFIKSFFDDKYTRIPTFVGAALDSLLIIFGLFLSGFVVEPLLHVFVDNNFLLSENFPKVVFYVGSAVWTIYMLNVWRLVRTLKKREGLLRIWADGRAEVIPSRQAIPELACSTLYSAQLRGVRVDFALSGDNWTLADMRFDVIRYIASDEDVPVAMSYQNILAFKLPRTVPNIFFDNKQYSSNAFRWIFKSGQHDELEGDFMNYFKVYSPVEWNIDLRQIVTPDVMQALVNLKDCDVELAGRWVYLYSPFSSHPGKSLDSLLLRGKKLCKELNDNLDTYKDDRLPYNDSKVTIHNSGAELRLRDNKKTVAIVIVSSYVIIRLLTTLVLNIVK